jgi:hypothetical protein
VIVQSDRTIVLEVHSEGYEALASHTARKLPNFGRPSSTLVPLFERDGRPWVLLTKRTEKHSPPSCQEARPRTPG